MSELTDRLRKMSMCVYLVAKASVADDIADGLRKAIARITELEASLADSNEALQVMGLKLSHAEHDIQMHRYGRAPLEEKIEKLEAQLQSHSANTIGGPSPVMDAAPACERKE